MKRLVVYILVWLTMNAIVGDYSAPGVRGVAAVGLPVSPAALFKIYKSGVDKLWPTVPRALEHQDADEAVLIERAEDSHWKDSWDRRRNPTIEDALERMEEGVEAAKEELKKQLEAQAEAKARAQAKAQAPPEEEPL